MRSLSGTPQARKKGESIGPAHGRAIQISLIQGTHSRLSCIRAELKRFFLDDLTKNDVLVDRPWTITGFKNDGEDATYPVEVQLLHIDRELKSAVRTKYLFGADGARSFVRKQLGIKMIHKDPIVHVWGVIDGVVRTDFPDIQVSQEFLPTPGSTLSLMDYTD